MKKFKNDNERIAFLEDYRNEQNGWYLWKHDEDLDRSMWRIDLGKVAFIVEEERRTFAWPSRHVTWVVSHWYIIPEIAPDPFADYTASRTQALAKLKELAKEGAI